MPKVPVTVYTTGPACNQCNMTKKVMDREGIVYTEVDLRENQDLTEQFRAEGLTQAPIVTTDIKKWSGFRLDKIQSLAQYIRSMQRDAY